MLRLLRTPLAGLAVLLLLLLWGGNDPADLALFVGRFHPALVHLPIGILLLVALLEGARRSRVAVDDSILSTALLLGAWSAVLAAIAGALLSQGGGYDAATLAWHRRLGVAVAVIASLAWWLKERQQRRGHPEPAYLASLGLLAVTVAVGGWLGGELTHGAGYQTRYLPDALRGVAGLGPRADSTRLDLEAPETATVYEALVQPVLERRCVACHNPLDRRGGLLLDSPDGILAGGEGGPVVVAGQVAASPLVRRLWLPLSHADHMPPEGRPQPTVAEAETIRWWIAQGASFDRRLVDAELAPMIRHALEGFGVEEIPTGIFALAVPAPPVAAVEHVETLGATVTRLGANEPFLQIRCVGAGCDPVALLGALEPLAPQVAWLDLAGSRIDSAARSGLSGFPHLTRLHLERSDLVDADLVHLLGLDYLEYLNLYGTAVSDVGLSHLIELPRLRSLHVWQTGVTRAGVEAFRQARPEVAVTLGLSLDDAEPSLPSPR